MPDATPPRASTGTGGKRRPLELHEALAGALPDPYTDEEWRALHMAGTCEAGRLGYLGVNGWAGLSWKQVCVIGETARRYRIRAITETRLGGRGSVLPAGREALVPKSAIRFEAPGGLP